jgi:chaperonin GroEL
MTIKQKPIYGDKVFEVISKASKTVSDIVGCTMGPGGHFVAHTGDGNYPYITKDGVSVARMMYLLQDPYEQIISQILINAAEKQVLESGDGTTCTIVLANEIIQRGLEQIKDGANPAEMIVGIKKTMGIIIEELKKRARPLKTREEMLAVATISCNGDKEIANMIVTAMEKVGEYGSILHEPSNNGKYEVEYTEGYQWDKGIDLLHFCTDQVKKRGEYIDPWVIVTDRTVSFKSELIPLFERMETAKLENKHLVFIGRFIGDALRTLAANAANGTKIAVIDPPGEFESRQQYLNDIAVRVGTILVSEKQNMKLHDLIILPQLDKQPILINKLGRCEKIVTSYRKKTMIVGGKGNVSLLVKQIKDTIDTSTDDVERKLAIDRLARLTGGIAVIKVGGKTETEQAEKNDRVDDAIRATQSAREEGIVEGAGFALRESARIDITGKSVVLLKSCFVPEITICFNSNMFGNDFTATDVLKRKLVDDMFTAGIVDPLKVIRTALENAVSVACTILNIKSLIIQEDDSSLDEKKIVS